MLREIRQFSSAFFERYLEPPVIRFVAISFIALEFLSLLISFWTSKGGTNIFGSWAGGDYSCFYIAGTILNKYSPDRLYDFHLQAVLLHDLLPGITVTNELPFINPPFFALLFRPLSLLPFTLSFYTWSLVSISLYVSGFLLIRKTLDSIPHDASTIALLLALSFEPFLMESVVGGNTSAFGFFAIALALFLDRKGKAILSGMALGLCLYKPTYLLLILPMFVFARHIKLLYGFIICGILLAGISYLSVGKQPCFDYVNTLLGASQMSVGSQEIFRTFKYVDIFSFCRLLLRGSSPYSLVTVIITFVVSLPFLIKLWLKLEHLDNSRRDLVWASTITWTAVFNLHFAIYDSIIVVLAVLLTTNVLYRKTGAAMPTIFRSLIILLYITPCITQSIAILLGFQLFTVVLILTGAYQYFLARKSDSDDGCHNI